MYPDDEDLIRLTAWPQADIAGALDFAASLWHWPDFVRYELSPAEAEVVGHQSGRFIRFATGGWSGNESVIEAMVRNRFLWMVAWRLSAIGGLHIFEYPAEP